MAKSFGAFENSKADMKSDAKKGIKEGSKKDMAMDKKSMGKYAMGGPVMTGSRNLSGKVSGMGGAPKMGGIKGSPAVKAPAPMFKKGGMVKKGKC